MVRSFLNSIIRRFVDDQSGALAAEYTFLIVFISLVAVLGMALLGPSISDFFTAVGGAVPDTQANPPCPLGGCGS